MAAVKVLTMQAALTDPAPGLDVTGSGQPTAAAPVATAAAPRATASADDAVLADVLVEEISIDGMCGVY
jgi:mycofactocin precursor